MTELIRRVVQIAKGEDGVTEVPLGSNRGPKVDQYIRAAGYDPPVFWCQCFVYWVVRQACQDSGLVTPLLRTGSCDVLLGWAKRHGIYHRTPEVGDNFLVLASPNDAIHAGLVTEVLPGGKVRTMEGNSNAGGSSNGIRVIERTRNIASLGFVRWVDLLQTADYDLLIDGRFLEKMTVRDGSAMAPVRRTAVALGVPNEQITFDEEAQGVRINGKLLPAQIYREGGTSYAPVRVLAALLGKQVSVDVANRKVNLT